MNIRYRVELSEAERLELEGLLSGGKHAARKVTRAQILLAADAGVSDETIANTVRVSGSTVYRTKRGFVEGNLELALAEEPRPGATRKLSGKETALLVATACSDPPRGRKRWTLELLADAMVKLTEHESLSRETVRRRLAEDDLKPWRREMWCIAHVDGAYVARMEDVLDLYAKVTDHRAARDFAHCMCDLADTHYPDADRIRVVMDNLSTHSVGALYETFPAPEAHRLLQRLEFHYTPKHASWLNMVEIEIGVLRGQCLDRRIGERSRLEAEIAHWQRRRNASGARIGWRFTTHKAPEKLARVYPVIAKES
jgi:transposase